MFNWWRVDRNAFFAGWHADFASLREILSYEERGQRYIELVTRFVELAHQEEIAQPFLGDTPFADAAGMSFIEFEQKIALGESDLLAHVDERLTYKTRICHYDLEGEITSTTTDDAGSLLRQLRPDVSERYHRKDMYPWKPLKMNCSKPSDGLLSDTWLNITFQTNIWFPWVYSARYDDPPTNKPGRQMPMLDNRELAACHTPRLNRFLQGLREMTEKLGGTWVTRRDDPRFNYLRLITPDGIAFDDRDRTREILWGSKIPGQTREGIIEIIVDFARRANAKAPHVPDAVWGVFVFLGENSSHYHASPDELARLAYDAIVGEAGADYRNTPVHPRDVEIGWKSADPIHIDRVYIENASGTWCIYGPEFDTYEQVPYFWY